MFVFYNPWKHQKTKDMWYFQGVKKGTMARDNDLIFVTLPRVLLTLIRIESCVGDCKIHKLFFRRLLSWKPVHWFAEQRKSMDCLCFLTHFFPVLHFFNPWKHQKTVRSLMFSRSYVNSRKEGPPSWENWGKSAGIAWLSMFLTLFSSVAFLNSWKHLKTADHIVHLPRIYSVRIK